MEGNKNKVNKITVTNSQHQQAHLSANHRYFKQGIHNIAAMYRVVCAVRLSGHD